MRWHVGQAFLAFYGFAFSLAAQNPELSIEVKRYVKVEAPKVVLTHVRMIDGTGAAAVEDQNVVIEGGKIAAIEKGADIPASTGVTVQDLRGTTTRQRRCSDAGVAAALLLILVTAPANARSEADEGASKRVEAMANFLAKAPRLSVTADCSFDVVQNSGQKIEFGEVRAITLRRPDRVRIETTRRDGLRRGLVFDGKKLVQPIVLRFPEWRPKYTAPKLCAASSITARLWRTAMAMRGTMLRRRIARIQPIQFENRRTMVSDVAPM